MIMIFWTQTAEEDLQHIFDYITKDSKVYAQSIIEDIFNRVEQLTSFPKSGRVVPEWKEKNLREIFAGNYRIIYSFTSKTVKILTIVHGARRI